MSPKINNVDHESTLLPAQRGAESGSALLHRSLTSLPNNVISAGHSYLTLDDGRKFLDACGGAAVAIIGHGNTEVMEAAVAQMDRVSYVRTMSVSVQTTLL
jgi:adenosylmethionine-8-amino-7-oxononanoate aminotransferase